MHIERQKWVLGVWVRRGQAHDKICSRLYIWRPGC